MTKLSTGKFAQLTNWIVTPISRDRHQAERQGIDEFMQEIRRKMRRLAKESKLHEEQRAEQLQQRFDAFAAQVHGQGRQNAELWGQLQQQLDQLMNEVRQMNGRGQGDLKAVQREESESAKMTKQWRKEVRTFHDLLYKMSMEKNASTLELAELPRVCLEHITPVRSPLVLISQVQRSGGTLLNELFDGHPECHAHPYELYIGHPDKHCWPVLDMDDRPEHWFTTLFETPVIRSFREGYQKYGLGAGDEPELFRFLFLPSLQREIFLKCVAETPVVSQRAIFDAYMTSYFNAWLNNQNLSGDKKAIVAFVPRLAVEEIQVERFFSVYPDGKLLSVLREPQSWYVSARAHWASKKGRPTKLEEAVGWWKQSTQALVRNKLRYRERVCLLGFEDLLRRTEAVMRYLASYLGIRFDEILLTPTFNKAPIKANSSYPIASYGVLQEPITKRSEELSQTEMSVIQNLTQELYEQALQHVTRPT